MLMQFVYLWCIDFIIILSNMTSGQWPCLDCSIGFLRRNILAAEDLYFDSTLVQSLIKVKGFPFRFYFNLLSGFDSALSHHRLTGLKCLQGVIAIIFLVSSFDSVGNLSSISDSSINNVTEIHNSLTKNLMLSWQ